MSDDTFPGAKSRVSYRLVHGRLPETRDFHRTFLTGPDLPDALGSEKMASGTWNQSPSFWVNGRPLSDTTENDWLAHFLSMAVNEAVHEVLEYFQVDGKPWLNPHDLIHEDAIYSLCNEFVQKLTALTEGEG